MENIKDAIKTAIQMEKDGYSFYKKAAAQTSSDMGQTIFEGLAADEQMHLNVFQKIFEDQISEAEWENLVRSSKKYADIPIFPKDLVEIEGASPDTNELDAMRIAMDAEKEAIEYYTEILNKTSNVELKKVINEIIAQEKNHYNLLEGEFDHLNKTGFWYEFDYLGGQNF
jgi:rubrerythrin